MNSHSFFSIYIIENGEEQWEDKWNLSGCTLTFSNEHEWESTIATKWTRQGKQDKTTIIKTQKRTMEGTGLMMDYKDSIKFIPW